MRTNLLLLILCVYFLAGCASWKKQLISNGSHNDAAQNAILDFVHTNNLYRKDDVFLVSIYNLKSGLIGVSIFGDKNKLSVFTKDEKSYSYKYFPTRYFKQNNKLFYWNDSTKNVSDDLIQMLSKAHLVDTLIFGRIVRAPIDDSRKAANYYFCRDNLKLYKRINTSTAIGWSKQPVLKCESSH